MALINKFIWLLMALVALLASSHYEAIAMYQTVSPSRLEKLASPLAWASDEPPEYVEPPLKTPSFITPHKTPFALLRRLPSHYITANSLTAGSICGTDKYCRPSEIATRITVIPATVTRTSAIWRLARGSTHFWMSSLKLIGCSPFLGYLAVFWLLRSTFSSILKSSLHSESR